MGRLLDIARDLAPVETQPAEQKVRQDQPSVGPAFRKDAGQRERQSKAETVNVRYELNELNELSPAAQGYQSAPRNQLAGCNPPAAEWNQSASDVLDVLVKAGAPQFHTAIIGKMAERGYSKASAYQAIAHCQGRGWIWHNLVSGYELAEGEGMDEEQI